MRRAGCALLGLVTLGSVGCGGGSGTSPSASVSVVDGITRSPLPGVTVSARPGETVTVERAGYLRRDTIVARDGVISLWPLTVDETFVRTLVYSDAVIRNRLSRWPGTSVTVPRDFPADVVEIVRPWVALVPSDAPVLTVIIDPTHPGFAPFPPDTIAFALRQVSDADARILSAQLVFKSEADLRRPGSLPAPGGPHVPHHRAHHSHLQRGRTGSAHHDVHTSTLRADGAGQRPGHRAGRYRGRPAHRVVTGGSIFP